MDEIYYLAKYCHFSYSDIMKMPTYERKYYVEKLIEDFKRK